MIANIFGPVEGKRPDCAMFAMSGLLQTLQRYFYGPNGEVLCIFGYPAYPLMGNLLPLCNGAQLTQEQMDFNSPMSKFRVTVEWMVGEVINNFKFIDVKKNLKIGVSCVGKFYKVGVIMEI